MKNNYSSVFNSQQTIDDVIGLTQGKKIWVAYSGGIDSHVLLHLLATANCSELESVSAIHIDHGLHADSERWAKHCTEVSANLAIDLCHLKVDVTEIDELGMEAAARKVRYQAFQKQLTHNDVLLTAQHQHDQAETLLLQLFRGAGPKGLSAMPQQLSLGESTIIRPFLNIPQQDILAYASQHQLRWIDDPSNAETRWNRNYIRHTIWPDIEQRWPSAAKTISRSAEHCADATELMDELAAQDLDSLVIEKTNDYLPIAQLLTLSPARQKNLLRHYIECKQFALPSTAGLQKVIDEVCQAKQDSNPVVSWQGVEVRRYQNQLYFMRPLVEHDSHQILQCTSLQDTALNNGDILTWGKVQLGGLSKQIITDGLTIRFRQGGEQIMPQGHAHHKTLKHLFQQWMVPSWQRDRTPLLYYGEELIAVVGYVLAHDYVVDQNEQGFLPTLKLN
ncbi:MAG: tRNA lysidine(34) synthetase TilS [Methylophagaceae bacterium]